MLDAKIRIFPKFQINTIGLIGNTDLMVSFSDRNHDYEVQFEGSGFLYEENNLNAIHMKLNALEDYELEELIYELQEAA